MDELARRPAADLAAAGAAADDAAGAATLAAYRAGLAVETRRGQDADLARWARYLAAVGVEGADCGWATAPSCWRGVSWGLVEGFIRWQQIEGYSASTIQRSIATVRAYAAQAARAGALTAEALALINTVKAPAGRRARNVDQGRAQTRKEGAKKSTATSITPAQARQLRTLGGDTPIDRRNRAILAMLVDHGLRVSEVCDLVVSGLDLAGGRLTFWRRKVAKEQTHQLSPATRRALKAMEAAGELLPAGPLFVDLYGRRGAALEGRPLTTRAISKIVEAAGAAVGVPGLSPHDLRHFWATQAARAGADPLALQEAGGWASLTMPRRYVEAAAVANERIPALPEEEDDHA